MVKAKGSGRCWMTPALREATKRRNRLGRDLVRNRERWLEACREVRSLTREAKTASWRSYVESLGADADMSRMYRVVRSLKGGNTAPSPRNVVLEHEGKTVASDLRKADLYVRQYAGVSCHRFTKEERGRNRDVKKALTAHRRAERGNDERGEPVDQDFSKSEFEAALRQGLKGRMGSLPCSSRILAMQERTGSLTAAIGPGGQGSLLRAGGTPQSFQSPNRGRLQGESIPTGP